MVGVQTGTAADAVTRDEFEIDWPVVAQAERLATSINPTIARIAAPRRLNTENSCTEKTCIRVLRIAEGLGFTGLFRMSKSAFTDAYASVIRAIRTLREEKGVSQVELARRLGRSQQFVSYVESGVRRVDLVEFVVIIRALGGSPKGLFEALEASVPNDTQI